LELIAWAINELERIRTEEEAERFFARLIANREATWGLRPWSGAKHHPQFLAHVSEIATEFTTTGIYRTRQVQAPRSSR
jgi:hypothetical protein